MNFYLPHVAITVTDIEATKSFYSTIGFLIKENLYSEEKKRHFLLLEGYGLEMEVFYFDDQAKGQIYKTDYKTVGPQHIAFPVSDLEEKKEDLLQKGIILLEDMRVSSLGVKNLNITDPSGITVEFFELKHE